MLKINSFLSIFAVYLAFNLHCQVDFDKYQSLRSTGEIPEDFLTRSYNKIEADRLQNRTSLKKKQEKIFLEGIHYSIDELLHSGSVTFGDPITKYTQAVADRLLTADPALRSRLRFYTLKSNSVNAFSTDQGIVFVTTGLFSRLENEAQLAFVLAHEIAHYTEKHVVNSFEFSMNEAEDDIYKLSAYSQDNEFEADAIGLKMFLAAGYNPIAVQSVFDVLMFSHLPFNEKELNGDFYSFKSFKIPESRFSKVKYPILTDENYNDELSSHPNIKKRRENILKNLNDVSNSNQTLNYSNAALLEELVNISRYESVRIDVLNGEYLNALNTIYLLEVEGKPSLYLNRMKAASWLGVSSQKQDGKLGERMPSKKEYEGTIAKLYEFLSKENRDAINTISIAKIYECLEKYPNDEFISSIWYEKIFSLVEQKFDFKFYDSQTIEQAQESLLNLNDKEKDKALSKMLSNYYKYGLGELFLSSEFKAIFEKCQEIQVKQLQNEKEISLMSKRERKKYEKSLLNFGLKELIILEPHVISTSKKGIKLVKSEKLSESFFPAIKYCEDVLGMNVTVIGSKNLSAQSIDEFNENALLDNYLTQLVSSEGRISTSIDLDEMNTFKAKYHKSKLLLTNIVHYYKPKLNVIHYGVSFAWPPMAFILFPIGIMSGNNTTVNYLLMDIEKETLLTSGKKEYQDPVNPKTMKAFVYDIMSQLNKTKK